MSTYQAPIVNSIRPQMSDSGIWGDIRFDPSDAAPNYIGLHVTNGASEDATDWKVLKFTYTSTDTSRVQLAYGSWTNRASLFP
jgi:hypothetical protein